MFDPTDILGLYTRLSRLPGGRRLFALAVGKAAPYTGTIPFTVELLAPGRSQVRMFDRRAVRNHLRSVHAIALMNLGEVSTGLAMYAGLPKGARGIITNLSMDYTKKARGPILAECAAKIPTASGRHDLVVVAVLRDESGVDVARASATWRIDIP